MGFAKTPCLASMSALVRASYLATHCCRAEENGQRQRRRHAPWSGSTSRPAFHIAGCVIHHMRSPSGRLACKRRAARLSWHWRLATTDSSSLISADSG